MKSAYIKGKEATFYHVVADSLQCDICPHACHLKDGQYGLCHSRVNHEGILYSEAYAHPCAINIDPVEKKPLLHYYPASRCLSVASAGCNFSCLNCQNSDISQVKPSDIDGMDLMPDKLVRACLNSESPAIAYTYTEPITFYEYMYDTALLAHQAGIRNILVSAGYINDEPLRQLCSVIDAANIDLKSFDYSLYRHINHGSLQPVLNTLLTMKEAGVWLEITNLIIPSVNDNSELIRKMCQWLVENGFSNTPLHFSRFFPMYRMMNISITPLDTLTMARDIAVQAGMNYVYIGNVQEIEGENTYCPSCHRLLVKRRGFNVLENHISDNKCMYCQAEIAGHW